MDMNEEEEKEESLDKEYVTDAITGRPHIFSVEGNDFKLYPLTLGKIYILRTYIEELEMNTDLLERNVYIEALRIAQEKTDTCLTIISYHTFQDKDDILDARLVMHRMEYFKVNLTTEDIASLMIIILTSDTTERIMKYFGIDKEQDMMRLAMKAKESKNSINFGGKSPYGVLIDSACERYGWTKEYVVWGIDYASLRLMLADKISSVFFSDEEMNKLPPSLRYKNEDTIRPTKENMETILSMDWR